MVELDVKEISVKKYLQEKFGGKWEYNRYAGATWECDDGKRVVRRCAIFGGYTGDDVVGSQLYLYQEGGPTIAVYLGS